MRGRKPSVMSIISRNKGHLNTKTARRTNSQKKKGQFFKWKIFSFIKRPLHRPNLLLPRSDAWVLLDWRALVSEQWGENKEQEEEG